jgi:D-glycero-D-manno-heptose 1,7-bisphosphate phosphatase
MTLDRRVVFLDRDGVLTIPTEVEGKGYAPRSVSELKFYHDAFDSVTRLKTAGFDVVIVTNQPDVSAGLVTQASLDEIHEVLSSRLKVDRIRTCTHLAVDACRCRKPLTGLLIDENLEEPLTFALSWMVGDRDSDIEAGRAAGCETIFIDRGWTGETGEKADFTVADLTRAVDAIIGSVVSLGRETA